MRGQTGVDHRDAERFRLGIGGADGGPALRILVREQMSRRHPADGANHQSHGDDTATLHDISLGSLDRPFPRSSSM